MPTPVQTSPGARATTGTSVAAVLPAAPTAGNIMYALFTSNQSQNSATPPSGWNLVKQNQNGANSYAAIWSRVVQTGDSATLTYAPATGSDWSLLTTEFPASSGVGLVDSTGIGSVTTAGTTITVGPTAALASSGDLILCVVGFLGTVTGSAASGYSTLGTTQRAWFGYQTAADQTAKSAVIAWTTATKAAGSIAALSPPSKGFSGWGVRA